jgi:hypothetical protein
MRRFITFGGNWTEFSSEREKEFIPKILSYTRAKRYLIKEAE